MPGLVKIGRTSYEEANTRIAQLYSTGVPFPFKLEFACKVENPDEVEQALHLAFGPSRVNGRVEGCRADSVRDTSTVPRFQPPPRRTQHADFPHCAPPFASCRGL